MSRSHKKTPIVKDGCPSYRRFAKRQANKKIRREAYVADGKAYRKHFESWDIHDYASRCSCEEWIAQWDKMSDWSRQRYGSKEAYISIWRKYYRNK